MSATTVSSEPVEEHDCDHRQNINGFFWFLIVGLDIPGIICNILVVILASYAIRYPKKISTRAGNTGGKNDSIHIWILNMSVADLLMCAVVIPIWFISRKNGMMEQVGICYVHKYATYIAISISLCCLVYMNVEKVIFFKFNEKYDYIVNRTRSAILIVCTWIVIMAYEILALWPSEIGMENQCKFESGTSEHFLAVTMTFSMLFWLIATICLVILSCYLYRIWKGSGSNSGLPEASRTGRIRLLVFMVAITAWTVITMFPIRIVSIIRLIFMDHYESRHPCDFFNVLLGWIFYYVFQLNPIVHPFITLFVYRPYRQLLKKWVCGRCMDIEDDDEDDVDEMTEFNRSKGSPAPSRSTIQSRGTVESSVHDPSIDGDSCGAYRREWVDPDGYNWAKSQKMVLKSTLYKSQEAYRCQSNE